MNGSVDTYTDRWIVCMEEIPRRGTIIAHHVPLVKSITGLQRSWVRAGMYSPKLESYTPATIQFCHHIRRESIFFNNRYHSPLQAAYHITKFLHKLLLMCKTASIPLKRKTKFHLITLFYWNFIFCGWFSILRQLWMRLPVYKNWFTKTTIHKSEVWNKPRRLVRNCKEFLIWAWELTS